MVRYSCRFEQKGGGNTGVRHTGTRRRTAFVHQSPRLICFWREKSGAGVLNSFFRKQKSWLLLALEKAIVMVTNKIAIARVLHQRGHKLEIRCILLNDRKQWFGAPEPQTICNQLPLFRSIFRTFSLSLSLTTTLVWYFEVYGSRPTTRTTHTIDTPYTRRGGQAPRALAKGLREAQTGGADDDLVAVLPV